MLEEYMIHATTVYNQTVDEYNDIRSANSFTTTCHLREDEDILVTGNEDTHSTSAMAWFKPSENIFVGDVMTCQGKSYRIMKVIAARRLGEAEIQFKKCHLERFDSFVS